jgi:hypothetical protein
MLLLFYDQLDVKIIFSSGEALVQEKGNLNIFAE